MLVSYDHKLIYLKRMKVAGTSIEMFLQQACDLSTDKAERTHAIISDKGIVGSRMKYPEKCFGDDLTWYNHIPAKKLKRQLGGETWKSCQKIVAVRNPFDRMVSFFHWKRARNKRPEINDFDFLRQKFAKFILRQPVDATDPHMTIDEEYIVDRTIRFEFLEQDLKTLCDDFDLKYDGLSLPHTKSMAQPRKSIPVRDYFTEQTIDHMHKICPWAFDRFSYARFPEG